MKQSFDYLHRYQAGQRSEVWRELIELGEAVRQEPFRSQAWAVCEEIVQRAMVNLRLLHQRLNSLGYRFANPEEALKDAADDAPERIAEFEQEFGTLPLIAKCWYSNLESVDFRQSEEQLACRGSISPPAAPDIFGLGSHPVLLFQSLAKSREQLQRLQSENPTKYGFHLFPGGWASNCEPKGFTLPCNAIDGVIYNDGSGDIHFVDELRHAFHWGGFPFWQRSLKKPKFYSPMEYRPNFEKLLPVLREGLLEV